MSEPDGSETLLSQALSGPPPASMPKRLVLLWAQSLLFALTGLGVAVISGVAEPVLVSVFLTAATLVVPFSALLGENRELVWAREQHPALTNLRTARSVVALFLGWTLAYALCALFLGVEQTQTTFGGAAALANIGRETILTRRFDAFDLFVVHNLSVLFAFIALSFLYRVYGALLAIGWNACMWGFILSGLIQSAASEASFVVIAWAAVLPHLVLEAAGYSLGALGGVFLSRGVLKYPLSDPKLRQIVWAVLRIFTVATLLIVLAAAVESHWASVI